MFIAIYTMCNFLSFSFLFFLLFHPSISFVILLFYVVKYYLILNR